MQVSYAAAVGKKATRKAQASAAAAAVRDAKHQARAAAANRPDSNAVAATSTGSVVPVTTAAASTSVQASSFDEQVCVTNLDSENRSGMCLDKAVCDLFDSQQSIFAVRSYVQKKRPFHPDNPLSETVDLTVKEYLEKVRFLTSTLLSHVSTRASMFAS